MTDTPHTDAAGVRPPGTPASCWTLPGGGYLLRRDVDRWPYSLPAGFPLPGGGRLHCPSQFITVDANGAVTHRYALPRAYSLEDTLYILDVYAVVDGNLLRLLWEQTYNDEPQVSTQSVELTCLRECRGSPPFPPDA